VQITAFKKFMIFIRVAIKVSGFHVMMPHVNKRVSGVAKRVTHLRVSGGMSAAEIGPDNLVPFYIERGRVLQVLDEAPPEGIRALGEKGGVIASGKLEKGGRDSNSETFHATLRVNESRPAELGQQPEASFAWWRGDLPCEA
jgi:hypothetical protein